MEAVHLREVAFLNREGVTVTRPPSSIYKIWRRDPSVDAAALVANLIALALNGLDEVQVLAAKHDVIGTRSPSGSTVQSWPLEILPTMLLPHGRKLNCLTAPKTRDVTIGPSGALALFVGADGRV